MSLPFASRLAALALVGASTACAAASVGPSKDLRLRHVVLYQNGIGYFERTGVLRDDHVRLQFRAHEIDDVLKSLVVVEEGGAKGKRPSTVSARLPEAKDAAGRDATTWLDVVLSPRTGADLSIAYAVPTAAWKATYRVVLPDASQPPPRRVLLQAWALVDNVSDEDWSNVLLTLATGAPLSFASDLRSPRFVARPDANGRMVEPVATGPIHAEHATGQDRDADGSRDGARARILVESNELRILQQVRFGAGSDAALRESLPVIDETARTLVAHPEIRAVTLEGHAGGDEKDGWGLSARRAGAVRALLLARGVRAELTVRAFGDTRPIDVTTTADGRARNRRVELHVGEPGPAAPPTGAVQAAALEGAAAAASPPHDVAGAVRYDMTHPISIPSRTSTLVTIVNDHVPGDDVYLFRPDPAAKGTATHPLRAARLVNATHGLQAGSVAVFAGGTFAGEGLVDRLAPGETAMIPYALDGGTTVRVVTDATEKPQRLVALARGVVTVEDASIRTTRYEIAVGKQAPSTMFVRHARTPGHEARGLPPATESTPEAHLVPLPISPGHPSVLTIEERSPRRIEIRVLDAEGARLGLYLGGSSLSSTAGAAVKAIVELRVEVARIEEELEAARRDLADVGVRAADLRESLRALERTPRAAALQRDLVDRLARATAQMDDLTARLVARGAAQAEARALLGEKLRDVRLDEEVPPAGDRP